MLTTFAALVMPVIVLLMAMVINVGHIVDSKIKLQIAADRAAYAGAAKQAKIMNWMSSQNWEIQKKFLDLKEELAKNSTQSVEDGQKRFNTVKQENVIIAELMDRWSDRGMTEAKKVSDAVALANYPNARPMHPPLYSPMLTLRNDLDVQQFQKLDWHGMEWLFVDPKDYKTASDKILTYLIKDNTPIVRWKTRLQAPIPSGFLTTTLNYFFPYELKLNAVSMAQPHGGSIRECAFKSDKKNCDPYRVSFVSIAYATGENYAH
jgi:Flp pilus assembly protein TadG